MTTEIFRCVAGSRLFGTETPASDTDYKAVHIPDARSILLQTANAVIDRTNANEVTTKAETVESTSFPVKKYLYLVASMETNALEMLHAPNMKEDWLWDKIVAGKFKLMSPDKKPFLGYAKQQAMRYVVRGDRLDALVKVVERLEKMDPKVQIRDQMQGTSGFALYDLPNVRVYNKPEFGGETPYMSVFGREVPLTVRPAEAIKVYQKPIKEAGDRTRKAVETGGTDWKGLYHALRIVEEGIELFSTGEIVFPCHNAALYRNIRNGDLRLDYVLDTFEERLATLEELEPIPDFTGADFEWIDEFVMSVHEQKVVDTYYEWKESLDA